jgi:hypothetical protein
MCKICLQDNYTLEDLNVLYIRCLYLTIIPNTLVNLTRFYIDGCPLLTSIPNIFVNLTHLSIKNCPLLTSIPDTLINLTELDCSGCPLLTNIPNTLINLTELDCSGCPLLTNIPNTLVNLKSLRCLNCPLLFISDDSLENLIHLYCNDKSNWIYPPKKDNNINKLITLQRFVRSNIKYWIFSRWIKSRKGVEWIYHPDNIGGKMAKKEIERIIIKINT